MPNVAGIHRCGGDLVLLRKAVARGLCEGCYFARYLDNEGGFEFETCLKNSTCYDQYLPACEPVDASLIYTKLRGK